MSTYSSPGAYAPGSIGHRGGQLITTMTSFAARSGASAVSAQPVSAVQPCRHDVALQTAQRTALMAAWLSVIALVVALVLADVLLGAAAAVGLLSGHLVLQ